MSELYELPNGWEWKKLSDIGKISTGKTPPKANKEYYENGTIRFVKPPNLQNYFEITELEADEFITEDGAKKSTLLPKNSLMVCCIGSLGKFALSTESVITNQQINSIVFNDKVIDYKYGYYYGFMFEKLLNEVANEAVVKIVNKTIFSNLDIPLPPLSEQQRIVSKLDKLFEKIDKSIALHQKNMDEADVFMGSVLNDVFDKEKVSKWKSYQFDKISKFIDYRGKTPNKIDNGIELITAKNVRFGYLSDEPKEYMSEDSYDEWMVRGIPNKGDVLFTTEAPLGNVAILNTDEKRIFAQRIITFQPLKDEIYTSNFLFYYMMSAYFRDELFEKSTGTTVKGIKSSILKKFIIQIPPLPIQQKVVKYLDEISQKIEKVKSVQKEKMDSLKALKASILDRAFRGEL